MKICLFGADPSNGNLGVVALCHGALHSIFAVCPGAEVTVFDFGRGCRRADIEVGGTSVSYDRCGGYASRRWYRRESLANIALSARFGGLGNPAARALLESDVILDVSGGDSFSDIYGRRNFRAIADFKEIVLRLQRPLVLLPQTYGPFADRMHGEQAQAIVRRCHMAWARDERSYECLRELAGSSFDTVKHLCGVDVAFALPAQAAPHLLPTCVEAWLRDRREPIVGLNFSGLLLNDANAAVKYGLSADYGLVVRTLMRKLRSEVGARIVLVPHVFGGPGSVDSDTEATSRLAAEFGDGASDRIAVAQGPYSPSQAKWIISHCDWFCGTRMHAAIGAMSVGVPTAAIAYSIKTLGVFETCGQGAHVADPRAQGTDAVIERLWHSWLERGASRSELAARVPHVGQQACKQMRSILGLHPGLS